MALTAVAATNVRGGQSGIWSVAHSPYTVVGAVQVLVGSTLTINPGVTVKYAGAYQIYIQGTLIANGTVGSPIIFGSTSAGVSSGATMLKFEGTNLSNSQLSFVQMSDAAKAIMVGGGGGESNPGVACTGTLTVSQASITNAEVRTGGYQTTAKLVLDYTTVTNATIIGSIRGASRSR